MNIYLKNILHDYILSLIFINIDILINSFLKIFLTIFRRIKFFYFLGKVFNFKINIIITIIIIIIYIYIYIYIILTSLIYF